MSIGRKGFLRIGFCNFRYIGSGVLPIHLYTLVDSYSSMKELINSQGCGQMPFSLARNDNICIDKNSLGSGLVCLFDNEVDFRCIGIISIFRSFSRKEVPPLVKRLTGACSCGIVSKPDLFHNYKYYKINMLIIN